MQGKMLEALAFFEATQKTMSINGSISSMASRSARFLRSRRWTAWRRPWGWPSVVVVLQYLLNPVSCLCCPIPKLVSNWRLNQHNMTNMLFCHCLRWGRGSQHWRDNLRDYERLRLRLKRGWVELLSISRPLLWSHGSPTPYGRIGVGVGGGEASP